MNLKQGIDLEMNQKNRDTCTACAGTMILEFAALSRLTGDPVFEVGKAQQEGNCFSLLLLMRFCCLLHIVVWESKPCNFDFYKNDFLSTREYQPKDGHSVKFLKC